MTQLRKDQGHVRQGGDGMVLANLSAAAVMGTTRLVDLGYHDAHLLSPCDDGLEEQMSVRFLYVTIKELHSFSVVQGKGKARCYQCLAGSSFAAGN